MRKFLPCARTRFDVSKARTCVVALALAVHLHVALQQMFLSLPAKCALALATRPHHQQETMSFLPKNVSKLNVIHFLFVAAATLKVLRPLQQLCNFSPLFSYCLSLCLQLALSCTWLCWSRPIANCPNEAAACNVAVACHEIKLQAAGFAFKFHQICRAAVFSATHEPSKLLATRPDPCVSLAMLTRASVVACSFLAAVG